MAGGLVSGSNGGRRRRRSSGFAPMSEINVTPFVDVMLVLLIVFMVAAPLLNVSVPIDLPENKAEQTPGGKIFIGDTEVSADTLAPNLTAIAESRQSEAETRDQRVRVRGDKGVNYGLVMQVIGELNASGFRRIDLLSNPKN